MSDKRTVSTDALETLGTIITDGGRDAIHLAVEPVEAGESLNAGENLVLIDGKAFASVHHPDKKALGIADPFLRARIQKGEKFWLVVYPRQITSLRHVWTHPDFEESEVKVLSEADKSWEWIKEFADKIRQHPDSLMDAADNWVSTDDGKYGGDYTYDNSESYKDHYDQFPEFWKHYEIVRGKAPLSKESFFTCSC